MELKPDLVAEFPLDNLNNERLWKVCLTDTSKLKKNSSNSSTSTSVTSNSRAQLENKSPPCELKLFNDSGSKENYDPDVIKNLLKQLSQFIQVEHANNMLWLHKLKKEIQQNNGAFVENGHGNSQRLKDISESCNISVKTTKKDLLWELFFSNSAKKSCLLSPITSKVVLDLKINSNQSASSAQSTNNSNSAITQELIKTGIYSGGLNYALFDYSSNSFLKKVKSNANDSSQNNRAILFRMDFKRKYSSSNGKKENDSVCDLEKMYELVKSKTLTFEKISSQSNSFPSICKQ